MNYNAVPYGTAILKLSPDVGHDQKQEIVGDMMGVASKHGIAMLLDSSKPETNFVPLSEYEKFRAKYDASEEKGWYRFGQAFYNEFVHTQVPDPELFYTKNRQTAESIIFTKYLNLEE